MDDLLTSPWHGFNDSSGLHRDRQDLGDPTAEELGWHGVTWNGYKLPPQLRITDITIKPSATTKLKQVEDWNYHELTKNEKDNIYRKARKEALRKQLRGE